jgi:hypothetical protein
LSGDQQTVNGMFNDTLHMYINMHRVP